MKSDHKKISMKFEWSVFLSPPRKMFNACLFYDRRIFMAFNLYVFICEAKRSFFSSLNVWGNFLREVFMCLFRSKTHTALFYAFLISFALILVNLSQSLSLEIRLCLLFLFRFAFSRHFYFFSLIKTAVCKLFKNAKLLINLLRKIAAKCSFSKFGLNDINKLICFSFFFSVASGGFFVFYQEFYVTFFTVFISIIRWLNRHLFEFGLELVELGEEQNISSRVNL